jgi:hypothetical protein
MGSDEEHLLLEARLADVSSETLKGGIRTMDMQNKLSEYIQLFEKVRAKVNDDNLAMQIVEQVGKDMRVEQMRGGRTAERASSENAPATERQLGLLRRLGVPVSTYAHLSKARASELIDEAQAAR